MGILAFLLFVSLQPTSRELLWILSVRRGSLSLCQSSECGVSGGDGRCHLQISNRQGCCCMVSLTLFASRRLRSQVLCSEKVKISSGVFRLGCLEAVLYGACLLRCSDA